MFNLESESAIAKYQRYFLRLELSFERKFRPLWSDVLQDAYNAAANNLEHNNQDLTIVINNHQNKVNSRLTKDYRDTLAYFGTFAFDQFQKEYKKGITPSHIKSMEEVYWEQVKSWAKVSALIKSKKIADTTKTLIHRLIRNGMQEGLSNNDIVKQLREERKAFNKVRATMIVRTETHSAANKATNQAVKSTGYKHDRFWRATLDDIVRGASIKDRFNHLLANKQKRDLETPFDVSGEKLDFPGDSKGKAGNVVNCRCVLTYHTKRF